jgi:hypothetical protein
MRAAAAFFSDLERPSEAITRWSGVLRLHPSIGRLVIGALVRFSIISSREYSSAALELTAERSRRFAIASRILSVANLAHATDFRFEWFRRDHLVTVLVLHDSNINRTVGFLNS